MWKTIRNSVVILTVIFSLDSTVGRWLLAKLTTTFRATHEIGPATKSGRLLVFIPGFMHDSDRSIASVKEAMMEGYAGGLFVNFGFHRFLQKQVVEKTAEAINYVVRLDPQARYDSVTLHGSSLGGRLTGQVAALLRTKYEWDRALIDRIVMDETPPVAETFMPDALNAAKVTSKVYAGPLLSLIAALIIKRLMIPPFAGEIDDDLDVGIVQWTAVNNMARNRLSLIADQNRSLMDDNLAWAEGLAGLDVIYIACDEHNITVTQPAAAQMMKRLAKAARFIVLGVWSPHVGYEQRPAEWRSAYRRAHSPNFPVG